MTLLANQGHDDVFERLSREGKRELVFWYDAGTSLRAVLCIHDSRREISLGGVRFLPYADQRAAVEDAVSLAEGMTLKLAAADTSFGGAKVVVMRPDAAFDRVRLFESLGKRIATLAGRFQTGEDMGTTPADMAAIARHTRYVWGLPADQGGHGDPSPYTARGVVASLERVFDVAFDQRGLRGLRVAVQGCGSVGSKLAEQLSALGAELFLCDTESDRARSLGQRLRCEVVPASAIWDVPCDVFAPCAGGGVLTSDSVKRLRCRVVAGATNSQLESEELDLALESRKILYLPDFVVNAGGVLYLTSELRRTRRDDIDEELAAIGVRAAALVTEASKRGMTPLGVALEHARSRMAEP